MVYDVTAQTGLAWIPLALGYTVVLIGVISVLAVQYMKRKTLVARIVVGFAGIAFWALVLFTPWTAAFAIESRLSSRPNAGNAVAVSFDPTIGRLQRSGPRGGSLDYTVYIPLRVEGLPPGSIARVDLSDAYSVDELGQRKHFSRDRNLDLHNNGPNYLQLQLNPLPPCVTLLLMNLPQPYVMRPSLKCYRDYSPHYGYLAPGGEAVEAAAYIRDPSSKVRYPNDMKTTQASLRWYTPVDHFDRKIVISEMHLRDWTSEIVVRP